MSDPIFKYSRRVTYADCTVGNHVYYSRYLDILEEARGEMFRQAGCPLLGLQESGIGFPVIGLTANYKGPARYDDMITIELWLTELGGIRLTFGYRILHPTGSLLVEGETRHICASIEEKPKRLPKEVLEHLQFYVLPHRDLLDRPNEPKRG